MKKLVGSIAIALCMMAGTAQAQEPAAPASGDAPPAAPAPTTDQSQLYIMSLSHFGTGCPAGTVASNVSVDAKAMTLLFDSFVVETAKRVSYATKKCVVDVKMHIPEGWRYTMYYLDTRGYAQLQKGSTGLATTRYAMSQGKRFGPEIPIATTILRGPVATDYYKRGVAPIVTWSVCGETTSTVRIDTALQIWGGPSMMTVDSIDGEMTQKYGFAWSKCPKKKK